MSGAMSSIRTGMPSRRPSSPGPVSPARATARSASLSAAQIQVALAPGPSAASPSATPVIIPPPPRLPVSEPSAPKWYETGPRLDATSTR